MRRAAVRSRPGPHEPTKVQRDNVEWAAARVHACFERTGRKVGRVDECAALVPDFYESLIRREIAIPHKAVGWPSG